TASAQPEDITTGPDGNLWFTEPGVNKVGVLVLPPINLTVLDLKGSEGVAFSGPVATFTTGVSGDSPSNYNASVDWGDGSSPTTNITPTLANGLFTVSASHTYAEEQAAPYTVKVTVNGTYQTTIRTGPFAVKDAALTPTPQALADITVGTALTNVTL